MMKDESTRGMTNDEIRIHEQITNFRISEFPN